MNKKEMEMEVRSALLQTNDFTWSIWVNCSCFCIESVSGHDACVDRRSFQGLQQNSKKKAVNTRKFWQCCQSSGLGSDKMFLDDSEFPCHMCEVIDNSFFQQIHFRSSNPRTFPVKFTIQVFFHLKALVWRLPNTTVYSEVVLHSRFVKKIESSLKDYKKWQSVQKSQKTKKGSFFCCYFSPNQVVLTLQFWSLLKRMTIFIVMLGHQWSYCVWEFKVHHPIDRSANHLTHEWVQFGHDCQFFVISFSNFCTIGLRCPFCPSGFISVGGEPCENKVCVFMYH